MYRDDVTAQGNRKALGVEKCIVLSTVPLRVGREIRGVGTSCAMESIVFIFRASQKHEKEWVFRVLPKKPPVVLEFNHKVALSH